MIKRQMFQDRLRSVRVEKGLRQQDVADKFGITRHAYQNYELGQRFPSFTMLNAIADFFGVSIDYLFGRTDNPQVA